MNDLMPPLNEKENNDSKSIPVSKINSNNLSNITTSAKAIESNSPKKTVPLPTPLHPLPSQQFKEKVLIS
jgi:hypothetical protein